MNSDERAAMERDKLFSEYAENQYRLTGELVADLNHETWDTAWEAATVLALQECAKLVCPLCKSGKSALVKSERFGLIHSIPDGPMGDFICDAVAIHAKIAQLSGKESQ